jgi:hypothetical protein
MGVSGVAAGRVGKAHKAISGVDALAALVLCNLDDTVAIEVGRGIAEIDGVWGAEGVLGSRIWVCEEGCGAHAVFSSSAADTSGVAG